MRTPLLCLLVLGVLVGACSESGAADSAGFMPVMDAGELEERAADALGFVDRMYGSWPDLDAVFSDLTDDAVFYDPNAGDYFVGRQATIDFWDGVGMTFYFPDYNPTPKSAFLSAEDFALSVDWVGLGPSEPWPDGVEVFTFDGDQIAEYVLWYSDDTIATTDLALDPDELDDWVSEYTSTWTSGSNFSDLYTDDAVFADTMFGITATGASEIGEVAQDRFGGDLPDMISIQDVYAWAIGRALVDPTSDTWEGDLVGVGFIYQWPLELDGKSVTIESLALCEFGTMEGQYFTAEPNQLIVKEMIFHNPDTLTQLTP